MGSDAGSAAVAVLRSDGDGAAERLAGRRWEPLIFDKIIASPEPHSDSSGRSLVGDCFVAHAGNPDFATRFVLPQRRVGDQGSKLPPLG